MNKLLLTAILYLFFGSLSAQTNYAAHLTGDKPTAMLVDGNLTFYATSEDSIRWTKARLYCFNDTLKFRRTLYLSERVKITDIKKLSDGNIGICGSFWPQCDVLQLMAFYTELDTNGNLLSQVINPILFTNPFKNEVKFFELPGGDKLVVADSTLGIVNGPAFNIYQEDSIGVVNCSYTDTMHHLGYINNSAITNTVTSYFNVYDLNNGNLISLFPFPYSISKMMKAPNNFYYGLTDSSYVIKFDTLFNIISSSKLNQGAYKINDFDIKQDTIYACTKNTLTILKFDANLNLVYQHTNTQSLISFFKIKVTNNSVMLLAYEEANNSGVKHPNSLMEYTELNGKLVLRNDASVEDAFVLTGSSAPWPVNNTWPVYINTNYSLMVKVRNNGTDTLKSVYLNQRPWYSQSFICGYYLNHYLAENLSIPPGQYAYVTMPTYQDQFLVYPGHHPINDSVSLSTTCVWTSAPNNDGDNNHMNDALCNVKIKLPVPTDLVNHKTEDQQIRIYPNPAGQDITVEIADRRKEIASGMELKVTNALGQLVLQRTLDYDKNTVHVENLESGIYFMEVSKNNNVVYNAKFVKN